MNPQEFMETAASSASLHQPQKAVNYDESSMQEALPFSDSLKDLKNLRKQLYSAAEYFEVSYNNDDQKQIVMETLRDYAIKALVNTVDHLGAVAYKVNDLLDRKFGDVSRAQVRVSCVEQRLQTCGDYFSCEGVSQQSSVMNIPRYHKRYILPVGETMRGAVRTKSMYRGCSLDDEDDWHEFKNAVRATITETPSTPLGKDRVPSPSPRSSRLASSFSFAGSVSKDRLEKRTVSPHRFPLLRSGSLARMPNTPNSRPNLSPKIGTTPTSVGIQRKYHSEPRKSSSMRFGAEKGTHRETDQVPSRSKRLLKALLSRRKSRKDEMLYTFLDEY